MVRGEMASVKAECLTEPSMEELKRAYLAGPPPPVPPPLLDGANVGDEADALIQHFLSCRVAPSVDDTLELISLDQLEEDFGMHGRVIVEESRAWLAQHPFAFHAESTGAGSVPPLRPGGSVRIHGLSGRPELNGLKALLVKWHEDAGRWWVYVEYHVAGRSTSEEVRV